jgi:HTH-type transcriptional regulator / antitoxin HigA
MTQIPDRRAFRPDSPLPPGQLVIEALERLDMTQADLARRANRPVKTINEIIHGRTAITPETAIQFARVLGVKASVWNALETRYREFLAAADEETRLQRAALWLQRFPVRELQTRGVLPKVRDRLAMAEALLEFFGIADPSVWSDEWESPAAAFRTAAHGERRPESVSSWLRMGEIAARRLDCSPFDADQFRDLIPELRKLVPRTPSTATRRAQAMCAEVGVALVFVRVLPKTRVFGVTRWLSSDRVMIELSVFYAKDDFFWFTLFHEIAHLLFHGRRAFVIDEVGQHDVGDGREDQADRYAMDLLIPPAQYERLRSGNDYSPDRVQTFARQIGVTPGVVVGRLQHDEVIGWKHPLSSLRQDVDPPWSFA